MSFPTSARSDIPQHLTSEDPRKTTWEVDGPFVLMFWGPLPKGDRFSQEQIKVRTGFPSESQFTLFWSTGSGVDQNTGIK